MKILLVNYRYFISGGPEKYMCNIKRKLETEGHEVIPFSIHSNKNIKTEYSKYFVEPIGGRNVTYYDEYNKNPKVILQMISRSVYSLNAKRAIKTIIADTKPDIVYILHFVNKLSPSIIKGAKEMGLPVVLRLSDYFLLCPRFDFLYQKKICEDCLTKGYYSCIKKRCIKGSLIASVIRVFAMKIHKIIHIYDNLDAMIAPSKFMKDKMLANGFDKKRICYIPTFASCRKTPSEAVAGKYGLYFGRITEEKGVDTLVHAYEKLPNSYRLVIVGDHTTEEGTRLKTYVKDRNITNVEFTGFKSGEELENLIRKSRFTLIPSIWYDNLPNTALEAFQFSKPVLASNIGSLPELVLNGYNGYLFEPGNAAEVTALVKKMDDEQLVITLGENSHNVLLDRFSEDTHYKNLMNLFNSLVHMD